VSRAAGLCRCCGGPRRGKAARLAAPVADCARCGVPVCEKHEVWDSRNEHWICIRCARKLDVAKQ
jgi:hypothetical protein